MGFPEKTIVKKQMNTKQKCFSKDLSHLLHHLHDIFDVARNHPSPANILLKKS